MACHPRSSRRIGPAIMTIAAAIMLAACAANATGPAQDATTATTTAPEALPGAHSAPTTKRTVPPGGTVFSVSFMTDATLVNGDASGFTVLNASSDASSDTTILDSYSVAGDQLGTVTFNDPAGTTHGCGVVRTKRSDRTELALLLETVDTPAEGINPAGYTTTLLAYNADKLTPLWQATVDSGTADGNTEICSPGVWGADLAKRLSVTSDGRYAVLPLASTALVVDLSNGHVRTDPQAVGTLGAYVQDDQIGDDNLTTIIRITDPSTGTTLGTMTDPTLLDDSDGLFDTDDGSGALATVATGANPGDGDTEAVTLPGGQLRWRLTTPTGLEQIVHALDPQTHTLLVGDDGDGVYAFNEQTGTPLWKVPAAALCAAADGKVFVSANEQLAVLDAMTGRQLSFDPQISSCPSAVLTGGYYVDGSGSTVTVLRFPGYRS